MNRILLVVPARKGSSFHRKNLQLVSGQSLVAHALNSTQIKIHHDTILTTDDPYAVEEGISNGVLIDSRPSNLADHLSTLDQVIHYIAITYPDYDYYACLPPTSPLRTTIHVEEAVKDILKDSKADSLISVTEERRSIWNRDEDGFIKPILERTHNRQEV